MFRSYARKTVLALSMLAAATATVIPAALPATAAPIPVASQAATDLGWEVAAVPTPGLLPFAVRKMSVQKTSVSHVGRNTYYHFKLQIDSGTFHDVNVRQFSTYRSIADNSSMGSSPGEIIDYGTLSAPNYRNVIVACLPPPGAYCSGGYVEARANGGYLVLGDNGEDGYKS